MTQVKYRGKAALAVLVVAVAVLTGCIPMTARQTDSPPVAGEVLRASSGVPLAAATVSAMPRDLAPGPHTVTDAMGRFELPERDRRRVFLAMPGMALDRVPVRARHDADTLQGYGLAGKWLRQPAPAPQVEMVILMLPRVDTVSLSDTCQLEGIHAYAAQLLTALPSLQEAPWFRARFLDDREFALRWYQDLDWFAALARRACGDAEAFAPLEAALDAFASVVLASPDTVLVD
ncbi:hypothetical protein [Isoalcanivorax indicus]|uniref:hypothetical protein n=1 Tax=Isoalcanivorax indicus TaxID=2202653 RepID=UPI000DB9089B|nr:hypothetical protein [Isoalcanivorax indicus]